MPLFRRKKQTEPQVETSEVEETPAQDDTTEVVEPTDQGAAEPELDHPEPPPAGTYRKVRVWPGPKGWGTGFFNEPKPGKDLIYSGTGGGNNPVAARIAELSGGRAFDRFVDSRDRRRRDRLRRHRPHGCTDEGVLTAIRASPSAADAFHHRELRLVTSKRWRSSRTELGRGVSPLPAGRDEEPETMIKYETTVTAVGEMAAEFAAEGVLIFFGADAPEELHDFAVLTETAALHGDVQPGDRLEIDGSTYAVTAVGAVANQNLARLGHLVVKFSSPPPSCRVTSATAGPVPELKEGMTVRITSGRNRCSCPN